MNSIMSYKTRTGSGCVTTHPTFVWFFSGMNSHMCCNTKIGITKITTHSHLYGFSPV
jgi:hypothetical protein